jgi:hypothetical protein
MIRLPIILGFECDSNMKQALFEPMDDIVHLFTKEDVLAAAGEIKQFSVRTSGELLAYLDAMAWYAEKSRNHMTEVLLRAGIQSVLAKLPSAVVDDIELQKDELLQAMDRRAV